MARRRAPPASAAKKRRRWRKVETVHRDTQREALLQATLSHVPFDGWTHTALMAGARDAGIEPALADNAFPGGMAELLDFYHRAADIEMVRALESRPDLAKMKIRDKVALAVRLRLEANAGHREAIRQALSFLALPTNAPLGAKCLYRTVDAIWYAVGDRSTDFSFYTRRALLAGVYGSTVLYWLNDKSDGFADTWSFLDRRIADVMRIYDLRARVDRLVDQLPDPFRLFRRAGR
jgi:ubiquinone biosynthesis protein COQ9